MKRLLPRKKIVLITIAAISAIILVTVLIGALAIGAFFHSIDANGKEVVQTTTSRQQELARITILTGQPTNAVGEKNGDGLTGSANSATASAQLTTNKPVRDVLEDISNNLTHAGFQPYFGPAALGTESSIIINGVTEDYKSANHKLSVHINLVQTVACPGQTNCASIDLFPNDRGGKDSVKSTYPMANLENLPTKSIDVTYL